MNSIEFSRNCMRGGCGKPLSEERLRIGSNTCSPECNRADRLAYKRYKKALAAARLLAQGWVRIRATKPRDSVTHTSEGAA